MPNLISKDLTLQQQKVKVLSLIYMIQFLLYKKTTKRKRDSFLVMVTGIWPS